jgi:hypothetical protein
MNPYTAQCGDSKLSQNWKPLKERADKHGRIFLAGLIDGPYVDFTINLFVSSIAPKTLCNVLFVGIDEVVLPQAEEYIIYPCTFINVTFRMKQLENSARIFRDCD